MKKWAFLLVFMLNNAFAQESKEGNIWQFNLVGGRVVYQINKSTNELSALFANDNSVCVHRMNFVGGGGNVFTYENKSIERTRQYFERIEVNLNSNQVNIYSSLRNASYSIPLQKIDCSKNTCLTMAASACNF